MKDWHIDDVYGVARDLPANYIVRDSVDGQFVTSLARNHHIVIYGSSKQGKTCLRKYNLLDTDYLNVTCSNQWTLATLHATILKAAGYTIEGTRTHSVSGEYKINAKIGTKFNFGVATIEANGGGESGEGHGSTYSDTPMELDPADVNDIIKALDAAGAPKYIVLEDFHYLPDETQKDFAVALKAFHEDSDYTFIVVGVWLDANRLIQHNGDLTGRVVSINADKWEESELRQAIAQGEKLLNVRFDPNFVNNLLTGAYESIWIVQEACRLACEEAGIFSTQPELTDVAADSRTLVRAVVDAHSARYNGFLLNFADGFVSTQLEMYKWLLYPVLTASTEELEKGLTYSALRSALDAHHPERPINNGNITQALQSTASLQVSKMKIKPIILDYDQTYRRLRVVDRSFMIWLQHQDKKSLLADAGLPVG